MAMADHMAADGYRDAGYQYVSIDVSSCLTMIYILPLFLCSCTSSNVSNILMQVFCFPQDCWASHNRTADGELQPDPKRFPSGIPALANYVSLLSLS